MAQRFLALDWDLNQLHLVAATVSGGSVRFSRAVLLDDVGTPTPLDADRLGKLLRERLREQGISPASVLACLGRDKIIVKEVRYPVVPEHEEPNVVRFQAIKELTESPDDVLIDYLPLGTTADGERRAQVVIVRRDIANAWQTLCQSAGVKLAGLAPRASGMAACLQALLGTSVLVPAPDPADSAVAIVTVGEKWGEFAILKGGSILQARQLTLGPGLAGEIRRNLAVHGGQSPSAPVKAVYLALSGEQAALREKLVEMLEIPVHPFDPFAGAENKELPSSGRGTFAGPVGLLHLIARTGKLPINFVKLKQGRAPKDPNQRLYLLAGAFVVLFLAFGVLLAMLKLRGQKEEVAEADAKLADLRAHLLKEREANKRLQGLFEWDGVPWPDEIYELAQNMPTVTESFKVRVLKGSVEKPPAKTSTTLAGSKPASTPSLAELNTRPSARLDLKIPSGSSGPLDSLTTAMLADGGDRQGAFYRPEAHPRNRDGTYDKIIFIRKREPKDYVKKIVVPERQRGQREPIADE